MDMNQKIKDSAGAQFIDSMSEAIILSAKKHLEGHFKFVLFGYEEPKESGGEVVAALGCNLPMDQLKVMLVRLVLDMEKVEIIRRSKNEK